MMFPVVLLLERKFLPDGGKSSYYVGVNIQWSFHRNNGEQELERGCHREWDPSFHGY